MGPKNGIDETDIDRLGLRELLDAFLAPPTPPEPVKSMPAPANKALKKPHDK